MLVRRVHPRVGFVDDPALVDHDDGLHPVVGVDHVLVQGQFAFLGREGHLVAQVGIERLFQRPVRGIRLGHGRVQHLCQV